MAMPTTEDGSRPPMGMPAWAHHIPAPSGQQSADFSGVSAVSAPASAPQQHPLLVNVNSFHTQQQLHHPHLGHHQQPHLHPEQQSQPQPQPQQQFGLYDTQYYNPSANHYASVPFSQAPVERHPYYPAPQLGQLPGPAAVSYDVAPTGQPQPPAFNQPFAAGDAPAVLKQESKSPPDPPQQPAPTTSPAAGTHRQQTSADKTPTMAAQVEAATPGKMAKTSKSTSGMATRRSLQNVPSPKAGKKRSRQEADEFGEGEGSGEPEEPQKKRGRPRLTEGGQSRNERRRFQIREAQRAYRNRKDNRIVELEEQVDRLEREKVDMSRDFSSVLDLLRSQGVAQTSAAVARRFDELCQKYPLGAQDYQDVDAQSVMSSNTGRDRYGHPAYPRQTLGTISSASSDHHNMMPGGQVRPQMQGPNLSFGSSGASFYPPDNLTYEVIAQPTPENASFPQYAPDPRAPGNWIEQPPIPPHPQQVFFQQVGAEQALVNNPLPNPDSSAADEATFGRRLQRRTLERGLQLAKMKNPPPDRFGAVFGFCLLVESRDQIIQRLTKCLNAAQQGQSLNNWRFPFTNLGGTGLSLQHATSDSSMDARIDNQDYVEAFMPQHMTGFSMGPFDAQIESVKDIRLDKQMQMKYPGFEGKFLDAQEAEGYLIDRGIFIPPGAAQVEVEISTKDFGDGPETGTAPANTPTSGAFTAAFTMYGDFPQGTRILPGEAITTMFSDGTGPGAADPDAMNPFLCPAVPLGSWTSKAPSDPKFKAKIDVVRLVEELVNRSVCLGRAPGVRPKDIDRAVKIASGLYKATD